MKSKVFYQNEKRIKVYQMLLNTPQPISQFANLYRIMRIRHYVGGTFSVFSILLLMRVFST